MKLQKSPNWNSLTFQEKIQYYGKHLTVEYAPYVDKLSAKQIVKSICGDEIEIAKVIRVLNGPYDIRPSDIKAGRIIKSAHASRWNIVLSNGMSRRAIQLTLMKYNRQYTMYNEIQYTFLQPKFFIEEMIDDSILGSNQMAIVYMFHCINGVPHYIRTEDKKQLNTYSVSWEPIEVFYDLPKPECLEKMIELASKLSQPFEYVRIDFFLGKNNKIYFSEYTFTVAAGSFLKIPVDKELSQLWSQ